MVSLYRPVCMKSRMQGPGAPQSAPPHRAQHQDQTAREAQCTQLRLQPCAAHTTMGVFAAHIGSALPSLAPNTLTHRYFEFFCPVNTLEAFLILQVWFLFVPWPFLGYCHLLSVPSLFTVKPARKAPEYPIPSMTGSIPSLASHRALPMSPWLCTKPQTPGDQAEGRGLWVSTYFLVVRLSLRGTGRFCRMKPGSLNGAP